MAGIHERGRTILGEAGSGKSSLVRRIARQASEAGDWTTPQLRIPSGTDPVKRVASALLELSSKAGLASAREKRIGELLHRVEAVAVSGISLSIHASEGPEPYMALSNLLVEIGRAAIRRRNTMVVLHIDEVQNITDEHVALQLFVAEGWPVADGAGGVGRVFMEAKAQRAIVELACGEPFLFQLAGERAWYAGTEDVITAEHVRSGWREAAPETEAHMQRVLDRLPAREREFLQAMAELEPEERSLTNIARKMGYRKTTDAGPTAQRLDVSRGIIHRGRPHSFRNRAVGAYLTSDWPRLSPCPLLPTSPDPKRDSLQGRRARKGSHPQGISPRLSVQAADVDVDDVVDVVSKVALHLANRQIAVSWPAPVHQRVQRLAHARIRIQRRLRVMTVEQLGKRHTAGLNFKQAVAVRNRRTSGPRG